MGISVSASALIFFISFAICLSMVFSATQAYFEDIQEAQSESAEDIQETLATATRMDNAKYNASTNVLLLNATNIGSITLDSELMDVVVDGVLATSSITKIETDGVEGGLWYPASRLTVTLSGISSPSRVKLSTSSGLCCYTSDIEQV